MRPVTKTYAGGITTTPQEPIALDFEPLSKITVAVTPVSTLSVLVQVTMDNVFDASDADYVAPASARWFTVTDAPTTAIGYVTIDGPWRAIRLNLVDSGTGVVFQVGQATTPRA